MYIFLVMCKICRQLPVLFHSPLVSEELKEFRSLMKILLAYHNSIVYLFSFFNNKRLMIELESITVISNHMAFAVDEMNIVVIGSNLQVFSQQFANLGRNTRIDFGTKSAKAHNIDLSTGNVVTTPQHNLAGNHANSHIATSLRIGSCKYSR